MAMHPSLLVIVVWCVQAEQQQQQQTLPKALLLKPDESTSKVKSTEADGAGWKVCPDGSYCPEFSTCCPSKSSPGKSFCIPSRHGKDPDASGECCIEDDNAGGIKTGCPYGFSCAVRQLPHPNDIFFNDHDAQQQQQKYCKIDKENPPQELFHDQPRYELCQIPTKNMTTMHGFPIVSGATAFTKVETPLMLRHVQQKQRRQESQPMHLAYYSNVGPITTIRQQHIQIEKILIMIHGSGRNAEDYFCSSLALIPSYDVGRVLVIAPKFLSPEDLEDNNNNNFLTWQDYQTDNYPLSHSWRYGADALNMPVSSFETIDRMVEFLVDGSKIKFPNLKQIAIAGHSAGGQFVHRWALLSNSKAFDNNLGIDIRVVPANPRSYCYLDERRIIKQSNNKNNETSFKYAIPSDKDIQDCPDYNDWNWGLTIGGTLQTPYKDRALQITPRRKMSQRYGLLRRVIYLTGERDVIEQNDHCSTYQFQGMNRHERAIHYYQGIQSYFNDTTHKLLKQQIHTVPESPHDHLLMFQSVAGRNAIFNNTILG